jgi:hypothetical protein
MDDIVDRNELTGTVAQAASRAHQVLTPLSQTGTGAVILKPFFSLD